MKRGSIEYLMDLCSAGDGYTDLRGKFDCAYLSEGIAAAFGEADEFLGPRGARGFHMQAGVVFLNETRMTG